MRHHSGQVKASATRLLLLGCLIGAVSCGDLTGPSLIALQQQRAVWASHNLSRYAYRYLSTGFFNTLEGQTIRLVVLGDTVRSAQFVATNDSVPVAPAFMPTIDQLFAEAISARGAGTLTAAEFDPVYGYPTRLEISGPPDAGGVIYASDLELLP